MMKGFNPQPTPQAEWYQAIQQAQAAAGYSYSADVQHYLILTLDHFTRGDHLSNKAVAIEFLECTQLNASHNVRHLRCVGDQCLLLSGLFPDSAHKKNVSLDYFINIGREAYRIIAGSPASLSLDPTLFGNLSTHFIGLMDILHHIRTAQPNNGIINFDIQ